ncbi:class I tRNA ligase family protein, partial [Candidatus Parcubacteria bacterium]|nr:class I tRNA ligase family protein [Candidatus Parcubacteria bacterium]
DKKITIEGNKYFQNKSLKEVSLEVVKNKEINIIPDRFEKTYFHWMKNLRDWCISRQIWFGHRIPVWYKNESGIKNQESGINSKLEKEIYVGFEAPKEKYNKAVLLHAWGSGPDEAFFPWLEHEFEYRGIEVVIPSFPNPDNPDFNEWLKEFNKIETDEKTIVIGRSLGATLALGAAMRGKKFGNLVSVCTPLENSEIPEFFEQMGELDFEKIKNNIKQCSVIHSSNDPYIKFEISEKLSKNLGVELIVVENADHFSGESYKEILKACNVWIQDPDTLDTWFSSGLWTFSTLLDQDHEKYKTFEDWIVNSPDLKKFHPTSVMETGYDILFFWVARMILMTTYAIGEIPFEKVYLHGMVCDKQGRKMSKSLGNGIDPIKMIEKYGTDALRLSMIIGSSPGNDIKMYEEKIEGYRNFVNKLWNVSRFITSKCAKNISDKKECLSENKKIEIRKLGNWEIDCKNLTLADKWILSRLNDLIKEVTDDLDNYKFSQAGERLKEFTWNEFADWYIEISKIEENKDEILNYVLETLLKLCHPFIPFVTEKAWEGINRESLLITEKWPYRNTKFCVLTIDEDFEIIKNIITVIRNARAEYEIEPSKKIKAVIYAGKQKELIKSQAHLIKNLRTGIDTSEIKEKGDKIEKAAYLVVGNIEIYLIGLINEEKEMEKTKKEIDELEKYIQQIRIKLGNDNFVANAPREIVEKEREKYQGSSAKLEKLKKKLVSLGS